MMEINQIIRTVVWPKLIFTFENLSLAIISVCHCEQRITDLKITIFTASSFCSSSSEFSRSD